MPTEAAAFRLDLVDRLARMAAVRAVAKGEVYGPDLARSLGVLPETLRDAARVAVMASANACAAPRKLCRVELIVEGRHATEYHRRSRELAAAMGLGNPDSFLRSVFHAAMQTEREPARRPLDDPWMPLPGVKRPPISPRFRNLLPKFSKTVTWPHLRQAFTLSLGLAQALEARSAAFGVTRSHYMRAWLADLFDGKLHDLRIDVAEPLACYVRAEEYVLPVRPRLTTKHGIVRR